MKKINSIVLSTLTAALLVGCGGGSSTTSSTTTASGGAQKGPFKSGQTVTAQKLTETGNNDTSVIATTTLTDSLGKFSFSSIPWSGPTLFTVEGEYLDETAGEYVPGGILTAITDVEAGSAPKVNINILTHIAAKNIKEQMAKNVPIAEAKEKAKEVIREVFKLDLSANTDLEDLDITAGTDETNKVANTQLLKISAALTKTDDPSATLDSIVEDLADGEIDDEAESTFEDLKEKEAEVKLDEVARNIKSAIESTDNTALADLPTTDDVLVGTMSINNNIKFTDILESEVSTSYESNIVNIDGIYGTQGANISISNGEFSINGDSFSSTSTTINNGDTLQLKATSSASFDTKTTSTVTIGGVNFKFNLVTQSDTSVADTKIKAFEFTSKTAQSLGVEITSDAVIIDGIDTATNVSITGGTLEVSTDNGTTWNTGISQVNLNDQVRVKHTTSSEYGARVKSILTFGNDDVNNSDKVVAEFKSYTLLQDKTPDTITFATKYDTEISSDNSPSYVEFDSVGVSGISGEVEIKVDNGEYSLNGGITWTSEASTITNKGTVKVRQKASSDNNTKTTSRLIIGTRIVEFSSYTIASSEVDDIRPNEFKFAKKYAQELNTDIESEEITISGISVDAEISIEDGEYSINNGTYTSAAGTIADGDTLKVKHLSSSSYLEETETAVKVGEFETKFVSFTKAAVDTIPNQFGFEIQNSVATSSLVTSKTQYIRGINTQADIVITNGEFSLDGGNTWLTSSTVLDNTPVMVRHTSSDINDTKVESTLTIGNDTDGKFITKFISITKKAAPEFTTTNPVITEVNNGLTYSYTPSVTNAKEFEIENKPSWLSFNTRTGSLLGTPNKKELEGVYENIIITAKNDGGETQLTPFSITVNNIAPTVSLSSESLTKSIYNDLSIDLTVNDSVGETFTFELLDAPAFVSINSESGKITNTSALEKGEYTFKVKVTDSDNLSVEKTITLSVIEFSSVPTIPEISGTPATSVNEDESYSFTASASDINSADLTFSITGKPSWASFDENTGTLSGTPTNTNVGTFENIVISVSEAGDTVSLPAFSIEVVNVNDAPILKTPISDITVQEDATFTSSDLRVNFEDIDITDTLTYDITYANGDLLPSWMQFVSGILTVNATNDNIGEHLMKITATDESDVKVVDEFKITVTNTNDLPVGVSDTTSVDEDGEVLIDVLANDTDADTNAVLSIDSVTASSNSTAVIENNKIKYTPNKDFNGSDTITYVVKDELNGKSEVTTVNITVNPINDAPTTSDKTFSINIITDSSLNGQLSASDIDNNETLSFIKVTNPSSGTLSLDTNGSFIYTPNIDFTGTDTFTFKVNDGDADSTVSTVTINVNDGSTALNSDVDAAMQKLESIDPEIENIDTKLAEAKVLLDGNTSAEAKIVSLMIETAEILNDSDIAALLMVTTDSSLEDTSMLNKVVRDMATNLVTLDVVSNPSGLSTTVRTKFNTIADKLKSISTEFGSLFTDSEMVYSYNTDSMNYNDSLALRAGLLSFSAQLKNMSSYKWGDDEDFTVNEYVDGSETSEYLNIDVDPAKVLNKGNFFKLDTAIASSRLPEAKQNLIDAANLLLQLPIGFEEITQEDLDDITAVKLSLSGSSTYKMSIEDDDEIKEVEFDLAKMFDVSTAVDITSLGSSWQNLCNEGDIITVEEAKADGVLDCKIIDYYDSFNNVTYSHYESADLEPQVYPTSADSKIDDIVKTITKIDNTVISGQDVIDYMVETNNVEALDRTWKNIKSDERYLSNGNDVNVDDYYGTLLVNAYKSSGIDSRAEAKESFSTAKTEVIAKVRLKAVDTLTTTDTGPVGRGAMIAMMKDINSSSDNLFVKVDFRNGNDTGSIKYVIYKYDTEFTSTSEEELAKGTIASDTQTVYQDGTEAKFKVSIKTDGGDVIFNVSKVDGSTGEVIESYSEVVETIDSSYDLGIDEVRFRSEIRLSSDTDNTLYDQVTTPTKFRVHGFSAVTAAPTATLSSGDIAILSDSSSWYDIMTVGNSSFSLAMHERNDSGTFVATDSETLTTDLVNGSSSFHIDEIDGDVVISGTIKVSGYTDLYKSTFTVTNTAETTEDSTWDWTDHGATDLASLENVFTNGYTYFQGANKTFMLVSGGDVVLATYNGLDSNDNEMYSPSTTVVGTWSTGNNKINVNLSSAYKFLVSFSLDSNNLIFAEETHEIGFFTKDDLYTGADALQFFQDETGINPN